MFSISFNNVDITKQHILLFNLYMDAGSILILQLQYKILATDNSMCQWIM